jgi:hypothetical protein
MGEAVFFRNLTTKGLTAINSGERYFEGYLTVQVKDKQGEVTIVDELMKVLPIWIDRGAPISDTHSNRIIGKGINYSKVVYKDTDGEEYPAIKITGKIHKNYELDNDIWTKIKSGEYKGLSFGGATKSDREPMRMKDGSIAYSLKDLEHYEVAVCRDPAVPLALITEFNTLAKAAVDGVDLGGGRMLIKCDKYGCYVEKDNKEAGLKAPEARNEALVYDDKTHDQPSETPLENQAKIKKVHKLEHAKEDIDEHIKEMKKGEDEVFDAKGKEAWGRLDSDEGEEENKKYRDSGKFEADKKIVEAQATWSSKEGKWVKKGEDWSNADGDKHGMYNQDTDEGGMGKKHTGPKGCKCGDPKCKDPKCNKTKRDSVLQGYGGEENNTGEVHWSGSGSPYPKIVKTRLRLMAMLNKTKKQRASRRRGRVLAREEMERRKLARESKEREEKMEKETEFVGPGKADPQEKKFVSTSRSQVNTPSKTLEQLYPDMKARDQEKKLKEEMDKLGLEDEDKKKKKDDVEKGISKGSDYHMTQEAWEREEKPRKHRKRYKRSAIITNIHSRLKSLDFILRGRCHIGHKGSCADAMAEEKATEERDRDQPAFDKIHKKIIEERKRKKKGFDPGDDDSGKRKPRHHSSDWDEPAGRRPSSGRGARSPDGGGGKGQDKPRRKQPKVDIGITEESLGNFIDNVQDKLTDEEIGDKKLAREGKVSIPKVERKVDGDTRPSLFGGNIGRRSLRAGQTPREAGGLMHMGTISQRNADKWKSWLEKQNEKQGTSRIHQAEQKELEQAMGTIPGQTDMQTTTRRLGIGRGAARFQKKGKLKNIMSRVGISDFLLRSEEKEIVEVDGKTTTRKKKKKEYPYDKQKDGEFGGMNTGEVEWTEPRDTANSRKKRDKDVA